MCAAPRWTGVVFMLTACALGSYAGAGAPSGEASRPPAMRPGLDTPHDPGFLPFLSAPRDPVVGPRAIIERDGYISVQVNVTENQLNILGDAANEPSIAVDPTNPNRMAVGWRQFDNVASDFRQAGWAWTSDGGQTWHFPGSIEAGVFRSDPVVDADSAGVFYYNSLTNVPDYQCKVFRSFDGGQNWDAGAFAWGGDKQWQVIDTTGGIGEGNIYVAWNSAFSTGGCTGMFTRSVDGGATFEACRSTPSNPYWGTLAVGPDGELYISGQGFRVNKSINAKDPLAIPAWTGRTLSLDGSVIFSTGPNPGGLLGQTWVDVDRSTGPRRGWVYVLCSVDRTSNSDPADVMFARSTDGGNTWSAPVRVNDDPVGNNAWQWFGTMSVAPNGRIDVVWLDTRNHLGTYISELYYTYSEDGGFTWAPSIPVGPPFNPHVGWPVQQKMGDYFDMTSMNDAAHLAYAATYTGGQDVYYLRLGQTLRISFPSGVPTLLTPGQPQVIQVKITPGAEAYVVDTARAYYRYNDGVFQSAPLTPLGGDLFEAVLPPPYCGAAPEFYFSAEGTTSGLVLSPANAPSAVYTAAVGAVDTLYSFDLNDNPGFAISGGQWAFGDPTGQGGVSHGKPDPQNGFTGTNVYGVNLAGDYATALGGPYWLTAGPFDFSGSGGTALSFRRWLNTDYQPYVRAAVEISNDGSMWSTLWQNATSEIAENGWSLQTFDISTHADGQPSVWVRWGYQVGAGAWAYSGWNIDDIAFDGSSCGGPTYCGGDMNCDGVVNFADIDPFVAALGAPLGAGWANPDCPWLNADTNGDNAVSFADIDPFVARIGEACR